MRVLTENSQRYRWADIDLDAERREVRRAGTVIRLSGKEFGVLRELMRAGGRLVSGETLLDRVWGEHADPLTSAVRTTVKNLRRKLGEPGVIATVVGRGYRLQPFSPGQVV